MASGIKIDDDVKGKFQQLSLTTSKSTKLCFMILKFAEDLKKIVVDKCGTQEDLVALGGYDKFINTLPDKEVRYVIYDFGYINKEGTKKSDIIFISWHPSDCPIKMKMICASSLNALKSALSFNRNILEGDSYSEVDSKAALEKVGGKAIAT